MSFYTSNLFAFVAINTLFVFVNSRGRQPSHEDEIPKKDDTQDSQRTLRQLKTRFLPVYLLVNGADWLQGAYIYPIYKETKKLPEEVVAALFMTGFISAAVTASFTGILADRFGRRLACLTFCIIYSLSCYSLLFNNLAVLFIGRCLGGCSATLMYTVFESWLVTEFHHALPDEPSVSLSNLFGTMTTLNSVVAIACGIISEFSIDITGTQTAPFGVSVGCLILAFVAIFQCWGENYGSIQPSAERGEGLLEQQEPPVVHFWQRILRDPKILSLSLTSGVFEGAMYIFIFFKFPALKFAHEGSGSTTELAFGLIFAILMCSLMLGSMLHTFVTSAKMSIPHPKLLIYTLSAASLCFAIPVVVRDEKVTFWCFCAFEVCCGIYFPSVARQRERLIEDGIRAQMYGLMRIPLNVFVVAVLATTREGKRLDPNHKVYL